MCNSYLKKYELAFLIIINILLVVILYGDIESGKIYLGINKSLIVSTIIFNVLVICTLCYIIKKFWILKEKKIYIIFLVLNVLYILDIFVNIYRMVFYPQIVNVPILESVGVIVFLIGNLILILTYNRNVRDLEKKDKNIQ